MVALAAEEAARRVGSRGAGRRRPRRSAAYWFCDRAPAALQTCHHLHGGMGVDETYPLHRYFARRQGRRPAARRRRGRPRRRAGARVRRGEEHRAHRRRSARSRTRCAATSPGWSRAEDRLEMMSDRHGEAYHRTIKQMGDDGWMGVGWPVEYGGKGLGGIEQQIFANEAARADVHLPVGDAADRRPDAAGLRHREAEGPVPQARSSPATCTSRSATPSPTPAPTSPRCAPRPSATATTTSSTARRCGPPAATRPTTSGWPCAPTPTPPSTRASRC